MIFIPFLFSGNNEVRGKLDGPLLHMLNELRKEVSGLACDRSLSPPLRMDLSWIILSEA